MPLYWGLVRDMLKIAPLALLIDWAIASLTSAGLMRLPVLANTLRISDLMKAVAMPLATSPALWPPMPSARMHSPRAASKATESSFWLRARPGSVAEKIWTIMLFRLG